MPHGYIYQSKEAEQELAVRVLSRWLQAGAKPDIKIVPNGRFGYHVRSDMIGGLPRGFAGEPPPFARKVGAL